MTHPMLQLPYAIWSSLSASSLEWVENLSPTDVPNALEYRIKVKRTRKGRKPVHELLFRSDGAQYQLVEATNNLPLYIKKSFTWQLSVDKFIHECLQETG